MVKQTAVIDNIEPFKTRMSFIISYGKIMCLSDVYDFLKKEVRVLITRSAILKGDER